MIVAVQVCKILLCLTCIQAISRRFLLSVSSQCFGVSSYIPEDCTNQQVVLPKRQTFQMLFLPIFNLLVFLLYPLLLFPFFHIKTDPHIMLWTCIFAFRSLSLHRLLRFHSGETLLPAPTTSLFSASFVLTTSMIFPHLSCSLQLMEFFLLKTTSDVVKLLKEKQSAWAVEEFVCVCVCVCVCCLFSPPFPYSSHPLLR